METAGSLFYPRRPPNNSPTAPRPPNNTPKARGNHFGSFREKSGKSAKSRPNPTQIPEYFDPFLTRWLDLVPVRRSASKFPAQGAGQNSIWSHMEPNQYQNHVLGKCGFRQEAMPCRPSWILPDKKPMCSGVGCLRRFFSRKNASPRFWTCQPGQIFNDF